MSQDMTTRDEHLPSTGTSNPFTEYGEQASMKPFVGTLLKYAKGDYTAGKNNKDIPLGTELVANMDSLTVGWVKWQNNKPVEKVLGLLFDSYKPPKRYQLDDTDEKMWDRDDTGKPRDPWQFTNELVLKVPGSNDEDDLFTFATSSRGGIRAIGELCVAFGAEFQQRPTEYPLIRLESGWYDHPDRKLGRIKVPVFKLIGWAPKADFTGAQTSLALADEAPKAATRF